jgi:hypothetical protein
VSARTKSERVVARTRYSLWKGELPEGAWAELTDAVNFVVGAIIVASRERGSEAAAYRLGAALPAGVYAAVPALIGLLFPALDLGNALVYAVTLFIAGALTLLPGRLTELRSHGFTAGHGYPKQLRTVMWRIEVVIVWATVPIILALGLSGTPNVSWFRAVVWALGAVSLMDLYTASACAVIHIRREALAEKNAETSVNRRSRMG